MTAQWMYSQRELTWWQQFKKDLYGYSLMLWDGLGFFGCDHTKLGRLKGEKVNFLTAFKSVRYVTLLMMAFAVTTYILVTELSKIDTQKSQTVSFTE